MPFYISSVLDFNDAILIYKGEKLTENGFVSRKAKAFPVTARVLLDRLEAPIFCSSRLD